MINHTSILIKNIRLVNAKPFYFNMSSYFNTFNGDIFALTGNNINK